MRAAAALVLAVLLSGCAGGSPEQELREQVAEVTRAANAEDPDALREASQALADTASAQRDAAQLDAGRAEELIALAAALREKADLVDAALQARLRAEEEARRAEERAAAAEAARRQAEQAAADERAAREQAAREQAAREEDEKGKGRGRGKDEDEEDD